MRILPFVLIIGCQCFQDAIYKPAIKFIPGTVSSMLLVPQNICRPPYAEQPRRILPEPKMIPVLTASEMQKIRVASKLAREVLDDAVRSVTPGITDNTTHNVIKILKITFVRVIHIFVSLKYQEFQQIKLTK